MPTPRKGPRKHPASYAVVLSILFATGLIYTLLGVLAPMVVGRLISGVASGVFPLS
jgi:hypothetical protein